MHDSQPLRDAAYFGDGPDALFGWYHHAPSAVPRDCVAVICAPIGYEYTHSHRTVRHLADRLANRGIPAFRFDYHGTGDSPGTELDPDRMSRWRSDVLCAVAEAKARSGRSSVCLIGIRLGATLAAFAAGECDIDLLVMWNPCVKGRAYVRELQAVAMTAERSVSHVDGALESAGYFWSRDTLAGLQAVDLTKSPVRARRRTLLLSRDDQAPDTALLPHLGAQADHERVPGWEGMMAEEQDTVIPEIALGVLVDWVARHSMESPSSAPDRVEASSPRRFDERITLSVPFTDEEGKSVAIEERICRFGADQQLFGILSRTCADRERPAIVLFNAGAVHHVGPHRIYVTLARSLAAMGFACLRFDLEGVGDSVLRADGRENHPYPDTAPADAHSALEALAQRFGHARFIAMGLCSGAHATFHVGLSEPVHDIVELVVINPLTFYWKEGMSLATTRRFADMQWYKSSMRDSGRWRKLLRGEVNLRRPVEVALAHFTVLARSYYEVLWEALWPDRGPRLARDLRKLFALGRHVTFIIAEGDPGRDILMANARRTVAVALRSGQMSLESIAGADHTFSQSGPRAEMIQRVRTILKPRLDGARTPHVAEAGERSVGAAEVAQDRAHGRPAT